MSQSTLETHLKRPCNAVLFELNIGFKFFDFGCDLLKHLNTKIAKDAFIEANKFHIIFTKKPSCFSGFIVFNFPTNLLRVLISAVVRHACSAAKYQILFTNSTIKPCKGMPISSKAFVFTTAT